MTSCERAAPRRRRRIGIATCVLALCAGAAGAQDAAGSPWFLRGGVTPARIFASNPFQSSGYDQGEPVRWVPDVTFEIGRQTDGSQEWHHLYRLPAYGFGFSVAQFRDGVQRGQPLEAYTFFSWPFARVSERLDLTTDFGMGLSWHWQELNQKTASNIPVLGSDMNVRINWGFYLRCATTERTSVYTGIDFTHRSNGGVVQPDKGINVIGPKVALLYTFKGDSSDHAIKPPPAFQPAWEFVIGGAGGVKNVIENASPIQRQDFGVFQATAGLQRHFYQFGKIGGGTDVTYDGATGAQSDLVNGVTRQWRADAAQRWALGLYGGYEHVIGRFSPLVQFGYIVVRGFDDSGSDFKRTYQRWGWRYQINDRLWGLVALRTTSINKADVLEFGAGLRLRSGTTAR